MLSETRETSLSSPPPEAGLINVSKRPKYCMAHGTKSLAVRDTMTTELVRL